MRTLTRSVLLNSAGHAASLLLGFVASVVLARWLGPNDRGLLAVMLSVSSVVYIVTSTGLPISVEYHASKPGSSQGALLGNTLLYGAVMAAITVPVFWFLAGPISSWVARGQGSHLAWLLVGLVIPLQFVAWTAGNQIAGLLRFGLFNGLFALSRLFYTLAVLILLTVAGLGVTAGLLATAGSAVVMAVGSLVPVLKAGPPRLDWPLMRSLLAYGSRNQLSNIFQTINYRLDVVVLQFFRPLEQVGIYVVAQIVAELALTLSASFQGVLPIVSSEELEEHRSETTTASLRHHGILAAVAIVGTAILGPLLIGIPFGKDYHGAIVPMLLLLPGIWFLGTGRVVSANLAGLGRPGLPAVLAGVATVVTIVLDFALIPPLGIYGAVIASVAAYTTYGVGSLAVLSRVSRMSWRHLLLPTRADLRVYPDAAQRLLRRA
jgi:O-antigen/teichoic acid export membrane protein